MSNILRTMKIEVSEPILTRRLVLRPFQEGDLAALIALHGDPQVTRYLYANVRTPKECQQALTQRLAANRLAQEGDLLILAVARQDTQEVIGEAVLYYTSETHSTADLGYLIQTSQAGKGYATEVASALLKLGFELLNLHRMTGSCDARNVASAHVMQKIGMRREGHRLQNEWVKGEWTDALDYALLRHEWLHISA